MSDPLYDPQNIFARIIRGEVPCTRLVDDEHAIAFRDIAPKAPVHLLVIPKGFYRDHADFILRASGVEIAAFEKTIVRAAQQAGVDKTGYRLISNCGADAQQEVPHYHVHILGGRDLGGHDS